MPAPPERTLEGRKLAMPTRADAGGTEARIADDDRARASRSTTSAAARRRGARRRAHHRCAGDGAAAGRDARIAASTLGNTTAVATNIAVIKTAAVSFWLSPPK